MQFTALFGRRYHRGRTPLSWSGLTPFSLIVAASRRSPLAGPTGLWFPKEPSQETIPYRAADYVYLPYEAMAKPTAEGHWLKVGGENVAAVEIESYILTHPAVQMVQVVGVPDAKMLEAAAAFVELAPGAECSAQEIIDYCKGKIASFKVPRHVRFGTEWPMSATKIQKFRLQDQIIAELGLG